jgi:hypothetical protein
MASSDDRVDTDLWRPEDPNAIQLPAEINDYMFLMLVEGVQEARNEKEFREKLAYLIEYPGVTRNGYRLLASVLKLGYQARRGRPRIDDRINDISVKYFGLSGEFYPSDPKPRPVALGEICSEYSITEQEAIRLYTRAKKWSERPAVILRYDREKYQTLVGGKKSPIF